ncbi:MAG: PIN domain-containing protein [Nitrospirota bacterium]|mgnify:CR=1 FL=1
MDLVLVDTNIFVYALDADSPHHATARKALAGLPDAGCEAAVSPQILFELYAQITHRRSRPRPLSPVAAAEIVLLIRNESRLLIPGEMSVAYTLEWAVSRRKEGADVYDATLVGCMKEFGVRCLLTADSGFQSEGGIAVVNPLRGQRLP